MRPPSLFPDLPSPADHPLHLSLPRLGWSAPAQDRRFHGLERCPGPSSTAFTRQRHQSPTSARRQPASRAAPLGALDRRSAMRSPPEAGRGGCRVGGSILTQVPFGGSGHGRRRAEQLSGSGGNGGSGGSCGASRGGESGSAATASGRCESAEAAVERATAGREAVGAAATRAGTCATAMKEQRARARSFLLM